MNTISVSLLLKLERETYSSVHYMWETKCMIMNTTYAMAEQEVWKSQPLHEYHLCKSSKEKLLTQC
jgi:hypothetical protein